MKNKKRALAGVLAGLVLCALSACGKELADMARVDAGDYAAIVWDGRTYVPFCAVTGRGEQIGIVDGDKNDRVYAYGDCSTDEWIVNAYTHDAAMLFRESSVTEIPDGLYSEYSWNDFSS